MEVGVVLAANAPPPAEVKKEDGQETEGFADQLKKAHDEKEPEQTPALKGDDDAAETPGGKEKAAGEKRGEAAQVMACIQVCMQDAKQAVITADPKSEAGTGTQRQGEREAAPMALAEDKESGAAKEPPEARCETAPVLEGGGLENTMDTAEKFAQKVLREIKQQLKEVDVVQEKMPQTAGENGEVTKEEPAHTQATAERIQMQQAAGDGKETAMEKPAGLQELIKDADQPEMTKPEMAKAEMTKQEMAKAAAQTQAQPAAVPQEAARIAVKASGVPVRESMFSEIVSRVQAAAQEGKSELFVQLKPEHLGGLSISLSMGEDGLIAKIVTGQQAVHNMLSGELAGLQEALREGGIDVAHMEVAYDAGPGTENPSGGRRDWTLRPETGAFGDGLKPEEALDFYYTLSSYEVLAEQGGSVEFSA
jgi:flagellar hook-length control protein FliK